MEPYLPMTQVESLLKKYFLTQPELHDRIASPEGLSDYLHWLMQEFWGHSGGQLRKDALGDMRTSDLGYRLLSNHNDEQAFNLLAQGFKRQQEDGYIGLGRDVSVSRILRYMPAHWHTNEYFEVYYMASGECPIHFANEIILLKTGDLMIVAPGVNHANPCYTDSAVLYSYMVRSSTFERVFWNQIPSANLLSNFFRVALIGDKPNAYLHFQTGEDAQVREIIRRIYQEFNDAEPYSTNMINTLLQETFLLLLRRYEGTAKLPRTENFYWKHEFSAILNYIQLHYTDSTLSDLSEHFHYSERQISRIVQKFTGFGYRELILKMRMERAAELIQLGGLSTEDIATATGYSSIPSFHRAFCTYYGCTPGSFLRSEEASSNSARE